MAALMRDRCSALCTPFIDSEMALQQAQTAAFRHHLRSAPVHACNQISVKLRHDIEAFGTTLDSWTTAEVCSVVIGCAVLSGYIPKKSWRNRVSQFMSNQHQTSAHVHFDPGLQDCNALRTHNRAMIFLVCMQCACTPVPHNTANSRLQAKELFKQ